MGADLLPQSVRDAAARADALQAQVIADEQALQNAPAAPPAEPAVEAPPAEPPAPTPTPAPTVVAPPAETPVERLLAANPNDANEQMYGELQHAYKSLYGRAQAHRQRDGQQVQTLQGRIAELEVEINRLRAAPPAPPAPVPSTPAKIDELFTEEQRANFGDDMLELVAQAAGKIADTRVAAFQQQIQPTIQSIELSTQEQRENRVVEHLDKMLQPWGVPYFGPNGAGGLNEDPNFLRWLELTDAMSGAKRGTLLGTAWQAHDGNRMWNICSAYLNEVAPRPSTATLEAPPAPPAPAPKVPLASLAAPGTAPRPTVTPNGAQTVSKPIYTRQAVNEFYTKKRRGEFAGHDAEVAQTEAEIALASREGRII